MQRLSYPTETVLSYKITRNRIVLSCKDSPKKSLGRRPFGPPCRPVKHLQRLRTEYILCIIPRKIGQIVSSHSRARSSLILIILNTNHRRAADVALVTNHASLTHCQQQQQRAWDLKRHAVNAGSSLTSVPLVDLLGRDILPFRAVIRGDSSAPRPGLG